MRSLVVLPNVSWSFQFCFAAFAVIEKGKCLGTICIHGASFYHVTLNSVRYALLEPREGFLCKGFNICLYACIYVALVSYERQKVVYNFHVLFIIIVSIHADLSHYF